MRKLIYVILMAVVMGASNLAQATVTTYDNWEAFVAATTNTTTITFNDMAINSELVTSISTQGVTFSSSGLCVLSGVFYDSYPIPIPTNYLNNNFQGNLVEIIFQSEPVYGFAMNYGALIPAASGTSGTFSFAGMSENFVLPGLLFGNYSSGLSFVGFISDTPFTEITINDPSMALAVDSFTYTTNPASSVPVPAAIWLLGSGLLGLFGVRRKFSK